MDSMSFSLIPPAHLTGGNEMKLTFECEMIQTLEEAYEAGKRAAQFTSKFLSGYEAADLDES